MLANHGPVVAGKDVESACNAIEELENTARLALLMRGIRKRQLTPSQVRNLVTHFHVEWDQCADSGKISSFLRID
jgi:ribulose-5-phosphate 4-epimerase/fuculose-1-phosphate aldolase